MMVVSYTTMKTVMTKSTLVSESEKSIPNIALHVSVTPYLPKLPDIYTG